VTKPAAIAVQLAYRATFGIGPPFSQVPPFTLLEDGTFIGTPAEGPIYTTSLTRDEVARVIRHVRELGFEKLENHTDHCQPTSSNTEVCTSDASYSILRVALPGGLLREIPSYGGFSNEPEILRNIVEYLEHPKYPHTASYRPTVAALHVQQQQQPPVADCKAIDPALLRVEDRDFWAFEIDGPELVSVLATAPANNAAWFACVNRLMYRLTLVPGVPGSDLSAELASYKR